MSTDAITISEPTTQRALITKEVLRYEAEQRALLSEYVKQQMKEGTDYGTIPGTPKPTLLKPGAEKLVALFRCTPKFALLEKQSHQDFDRGFFAYTFRCRIYSRDAEAVVAEGYGSANSYESRYRWRDGKRKCPSCGSDALLLSKQKPEWFCWAKKGGCGAIYPKDDKRITEQQVGRIENPDLADMANTVLKMAKKRALVDASIALARCSDMFTQDLEDGASDDDSRPAQESQQQASAPKAAPPPQRQQQRQSSPSKAAKPAPREPVDAQTAAAVDDPQSPAAHAVEASDLIGFGRHKTLKRAEARTSQLEEALAEGEETLRRWPNAHNAPGVRRAMDAIRDEMKVRAAIPLGGTPPAEVVNIPKPLSPAAEAKAAEVAKALGGEVVFDAKVEFGTWKGRLVSSLTDAELSAAVDFANGKLLESPRAPWAKKMTANVEVLLTERDLRTAGVRAQRQPGQEG